MTGWNELPAIDAPSGPSARLTRVVTFVCRSRTKTWSRLSAGAPASAAWLAQVTRPPSASISPLSVDSAGTVPVAPLSRSTRVVVFVSMLRT